MISPEKWRRLPRKPGVYLMKGSSGDVLYVGKAIDVRRRVASYFGRRYDSRPFGPAFVSQVKDIECIVTDTEKEALLLEHTLIKKHWPRYNVSLKGDTPYAHIRLSVDEAYPCLTITRNVQKDGARYFGPYTSAAAARTTTRFLQKIFPLRECSSAELSQRKRPCIKYQIKRCSGPCCGMIGKAEYREIVRRVSLFLSGKTGSLIKVLEKEMNGEAEGLNYEKAAAIRDTIEAIMTTVEKQKIVTRDQADRDAVGLHREEGGGEAAFLFVRGGKLIGVKTVALEGPAEEDAESIRRILIGHYMGGAYVPPEILIPCLPAEHGAVQALISEARGGPVRLVVPRGGDRRALVKLAASNAEAALRAGRDREVESERILAELQRYLRLPGIPRLIECVDISDIGGQSAVGAVVAFREGVAYRDGYRRFKIKTGSGADDCRMIYEVVLRRARRGLSGWGMPDLIVVDGGRGQLTAALRALSEGGAKSTAAVALAKEREIGGRRAGERIFREGRKNPVALKEGSPVSLFLMRMRDEAHRFAVQAHRGMRDKKLFSSMLDALRGIGGKRRELLLAAFGSIRGVARASLADLERVLKNRGVAKRVHTHFAAPEGSAALNGARLTRLPHCTESENSVQ